jgi:hypothetical protein
VGSGRLHGRPRFFSGFLFLSLDPFFLPMKPGHVHGRLTPTYIPSMHCYSWLPGFYVHGRSHGWTLLPSLTSSTIRDRLTKTLLPVFNSLFLLSCTPFYPIIPYGGPRFLSPSPRVGRKTFWKTSKPITIANHPLFKPDSFLFPTPLLLQLKERDLRKSATEGWGHPVGISSWCPFSPSNPASAPLPQPVPQPLCPPLCLPSFSASVTQERLHQDPGLADRVNPGSQSKALIGAAHDEGILFRPGFARETPQKTIDHQERSSERSLFA